MISRGKLSASISESREFLSSFQLFKSSGPKGNGIYSEEFINASRSNKQYEIHRIAIENFDYDILLFDDSIFQYCLVDTKLRYAFIQNPTVFYSKEEYLHHIFNEDELDGCPPDEIDDLIDQDAYEQFLNEQSINDCANYFRYDCSLIGYEPLIHPCSHMHIGANNNVRIPISRVLTPLEFSKFCIKNTYFDRWKEKVVQTNNFHEEVKRIKDECSLLKPDAWQEIERNELYMT